MEEFCATETGHRSYERRRASPTKTVWVSSPMARRLAHLALHKNDLAFAEMALVSIQTALRNEPVLGEMAWRMAVLHTMKCFTRHPSRVHLDERTIFPRDAFCREVFSYFQAMREKLFVYDENSYRDCRVGLVINGQHAPRKAEKAKVFAIPTAMPPQADLIGLHYLIGKSLDWVNAETDRVAHLVTAEYERRPYAELDGLAEIEGAAPGIREIRLGRDGGGR